MNIKKVLQIIVNRFRKSSFVLTIFILSEVVNLVVYKLYNIIFEPFIYSTAIIAAVLVVYFIVSVLKDIHRTYLREQAKAGILSGQRIEYSPSSLEESDYFEMILSLGTEITRLKTDFDNERQDTLDYYTVWVHQIKTPIAVMQMLLSVEDTDEHRQLLNELFRIEQYVEMVLQYIRLGSESNDLVFQEVGLDELLRQSIRKYASQFITRKLKLDYEPTDLTIVTDKKWFSCIIEQILSNAVKYTQSGEVRIRITDNTLQISDTGIGISPEDLPRIFEKGYTGVNGRMGQKSSGLGLYLCKSAADKLSIKITAQSTPGVGTTFSLNLNQSKTEVYHK